MVTRRSAKPTSTASNGLGRFGFAFCQASCWNITPAVPGAIGAKEAVIRVRTINPARAIKALEERGYAVREAWRG